MSVLSVYSHCANDRSFNPYCVQQSFADGRKYFFSRLHFFLNLPSIPCLVVVYSPLLSPFLDLFAFFVFFPLSGKSGMTPLAQIQKAPSECAPASIQRADEGSAFRIAVFFACNSAVPGLRFKTALQHANDDAGKFFGGMILSAPSNRFKIWIVACSTSGWL